MLDVPDNTRPALGNNLPTSFIGRLNPDRVDIVIRSLLGIYYAVGAGVCVSGIIKNLHNVDFTHPDAVLVAKILSIVGIAAYSLMLACLFILRFKPVRRTAAIWPNMAALLGAFLLTTLLFMEPRDDLPLAVQFTALTLVFLGNSLTALVLIRLGRSFSILPEARQLVTTGIYRYMRHPLYLAEMITSLGVMILFLSPLAVFLVITQIGFQILRMGYEEQILETSFPDYAAYKQRTARLVPWVY